MIETVTVLKKKKRSVKTDKSALIKDSSELLSSNSINAHEFLNKIASFKNAVNESVKQLHNAACELDSSESENETLSQQFMSQSSKRSASSQPSDSSQSSKRSRTDIKICPLCSVNEINIILFPCAHAVISTDCWNGTQTECNECHTFS